MFHIGPYRIGSRAVLAPMAGVSDQPFRALCAAQGAGFVVNEMLTSDTRLWQSRKSRTRLLWTNYSGPKVVQIAGHDAQQMAEAARACVALGADIVDINMGCPAKKVCNKAAGSALLRDEAQVTAILKAVVGAVDVPVTLKFRTGWAPDQRNAVTIAQTAEQIGVAALTLHGRTRQCRFNGAAEYDTIAEVASRVSIPIIANGDIDSPAKAHDILCQTGVAGVMIGRAAQGNPWIFAQTHAFLEQGCSLPTPSLPDVRDTMIGHIRALHAFYGDLTGARIARKHVIWYLTKHTKHQDSRIVEPWRRQFQQLIQVKEQTHAVRQLFERLHQLEDQAA